MHRFPGGQVKGFRDLASAHSWLDGPQPIQSTTPPQREAGSCMPTPHVPGFSTYVSILPKYPTSFNLLLSNVKEEGTTNTCTSFATDASKQVEREESLDMDIFTKALETDSSQEAFAYIDASRLESGCRSKWSFSFIDSMVSDKSIFVGDIYGPKKQLATSGDSDKLLKLSVEQSMVLESVKSGQSIFFTGPAGELVYNNTCSLLLTSARFRKIRPAEGYYRLSKAGT